MCRRVSDPIWWRGRHYADRRFRATRALFPLGQAQPLLSQSPHRTEGDANPHRRGADSSLKAERKSSKTGNGALGAEAPEEDLQEELREDGTGDSEWEPVPDEVAGDEGGPPLELTRMIANDGEMKDLGSGPAGAVESGAVQDIFKRVSMITGRLRET